MRRRIIAALLLAAAPMTIAPPAHAIFGIGDIVIDPSNLAQNILTAANTLEQINNQVKQLQNEADMLINLLRRQRNRPALSGKLPRRLFRLVEHTDGDRCGNAMGVRPFGV